MSVAAIQDSVTPAPLPVARLGRVSRSAGGVLARLWAWLRLPRPERFRVCSRCGCVRDEDYQRSGFGAGTSVCQGQMKPWVEGGPPWCLRAMTRSG